MLKKSGLILLFLLFSYTSIANEALVDGFHRRFKVHRDSSGKATMILDRVFHRGLNVRLYINFIKESIKFQQANFENNKIQNEFINNLSGGDKAMLRS